jgi:DNA-binding SARP family transcriptional activator
VTSAADTIVQAPAVSVRLLGSFGVTVDGEDVERWRAGKARALFQYLVVHRNRVILRDRLHEVLWPDRVWGPGSSSLKVAMHSLRQVLGVSADGQGRRGVRILYQDFGYALYADRLWVDVDEFEACVERGRAADLAGDRRLAVARCAQAMEVYQGDFLDGETADWIVEHREWCRALALRALDLLTTDALERGDFGALLRWCRRAIDIDPYREETYQQLMVAHGKLGEVGAARQWYDLCARRLRVDLGVEPTFATRHAYRAALRTAERPVAAGARPDQARAGRPPQRLLRSVV